MYVNTTWLNYKRKMDITAVFKEELMATVFHPRRFKRYLLEYDFDMADL
jgi:hypothetical protein